MTNPVAFHNFIPAIEEERALASLESFRSLDLDAQADEVAKIIFQRWLVNSMGAEAEIESRVYSPNHGKGFTRGFTLGAVVISDFGKEELMEIEADAAFAANLTYGTLLQPERRYEHADKRTPPMWAHIKDANIGYANALDRAARTEPGYFQKKAIKRGATLLYLLLNQQMAKNIIRSN